MEKDFEEKVLDKLEDLKVKVAVIESKVNDDLQVTKNKANDAYIIATQNKKDLDEIKGKNVWFTRSIGVALISALVNLLISFLRFK